MVSVDSRLIDTSQMAREESAIFIRSQEVRDRASPAQTGASSMPSRAHGHHLRPSTNADKLSEKGYLDIIPKRQVVQVRHLVYDPATSQPHLGARLAIFDLYKLFIFNKMDNVAHELLYV
jgi:hypothetical protein